MVWQTVALLPVLAILSATAPFFRSAYGRPNPVNGPSSALLAVGLTAVVSVLLLFNLAPAVINITTSSHSTSMDISVGNFTIDNVDGSSIGIAIGASSRAAPIAQLENTQVTSGTQSPTFGYTMEPGVCAAGWPNPLNSYVPQLGSSISYPSMSACWMYECRWDAPVLATFENNVNATAFNLITTNWNSSSLPGIFWSPYLPNNPSIVIQSGA
jgi:hypothetical protein